MLLGDYSLHDSRVVLVPIEQLTPEGLRDEMRAFLAERCDWEPARIELLARGFALYWLRSAALAARTRTWPAPRLRHIAVVAEADDVRPYAQMLNTSAWTLYSSDLDPRQSHAELVAFLLAHGDRMAASGEVTLGAVHTAPWWFERSEEEIAAFAAAAASSARPDGDGFRAIATAIPMLRSLHHEALRPAPLGAKLRPIPNSGLAVPAMLEAGPPALVHAWTAVATDAVRRYHARWKRPDPAATEALLSCLETEAPQVLVTGRQGAVLWDPQQPDRTGALRRELKSASGAGVRNIELDVRLVATHTRRFLASLADPGSLPRPRVDPEQRGYAYLHRERRLLAYNLHEAGIERLEGPALPYAHAMLGARAIHEWCHLAVDAGWVPQTASASELEDILDAIAAELDAAMRDAPAALRSVAAADVRALGPRPGRALAESIVPRVEDYRANLLAQRFLSEPERETYVRQNIRTLRREYRAPQLFRMLARYLYELQYLRFSAVEDRLDFFVRSTWFDDDFFRAGVLDQTRFELLAEAVGRLCDAYGVDESRFRPTAQSPATP